MIELQYQEPSKKNIVILKEKTTQRNKNKLKNLQKKKNQQEKEEIKQQSLNKFEGPVKKKVEQIFDVLMNDVDYDYYEDQNKKNRRIKILNNQHVDPERKIDQDEVELDNFLDINDIKILENKFQDLQQGEYVMVFDNPDSGKIKNKPITLKQALEIFENEVQIKKEDGLSKLKNSKEKEAFIKAFLQLDDYKVKENKKQDKETEKTFQQKQQLIRQQSKINRSFQKDDEDELEDLNPDQTQKKETSTKNQQVQTKTETPQKQLKDLKKVESPQQDLKQIQSPSKDNKQSDQKKSQIQLKELKEYELRPMRAEFQIDISNLNSYKNVKKQYCEGGFLYKKYDDEEKDFEWIQREKIPPKDFLTLIRLSLIQKFVFEKKYLCRTFLSGNGLEIFLVLKSDAQSIKDYAQKIHFSKQLELGAVDLFSLEPIDSNNRPIRCKLFVRNPKIIPLKEEEFIQRIESRAQSDYQNIRKQKLEDFQMKLITAQNENDRHFKSMSKDLKYHMSFEYIDLINDVEVSREEYEVYYIYIEFINDYMRRIEKIKQSMLKDQSLQKQFRQYDCIKNNLPFIYKLILIKARQEANKIYAKFYKPPFFSKQNLFGAANETEILKTIYDQFGIGQDVAPYTEYFCLPNGDSDALFKQYNINEFGHRDCFMNMERLKLSNNLIQSTTNILKLRKRGIIKNYYTCHNLYELKGIPKYRLFECLEDAKIFQSNDPKYQTDGYKKLKSLFGQLQSASESTDFHIAENDVQNKIFNRRKPYEANIEQVRRYFGEKIAIYFEFVSQYTNSLVPMIALGFLFGIMDELNVYYNQAQVLFSISIILWSCLFGEIWKRKQYLFALKYGQIGFQQSDAVRPSYYGSSKRDITNDELNRINYPSYKRMIKQFISSLISLLIICLAIVAVFAIFYLRMYLLENQIGGDSNSMQGKFIQNEMPSIINAIQIFVFNTLYSSISTKLNEWENHQYFSQNENSLIFKQFAFQFINYFLSFFLIAFLGDIFSPQIELCLVKKQLPDLTTISVIDCYQTLRQQVRAIFISNFIKNIPALLVPMMMQKMKFQMSSKNNKFVDNHFSDIDFNLEQQSILDPFQTTLEIDGLMKLYVTVTVQLAFLNLFAMAFPFAFCVAFVNNCLMVWVNQQQLINTFQRPIPSGAANIGVWQSILDLISFMGIFVNSGLIIFTINSRNLNRTDQVIAFLGMVISFLGFKYLINLSIPDQPPQAQIYEKRGKRMIEKNIQGFIQKRVKIPKSMHPQLKVEGILQDLQSYLKQN